MRKTNEESTDCNKQTQLPMLGFYVQGRCAERAPTHLGRDRLCERHRQQHLLGLNVVCRHHAPAQGITQENSLHPEVGRRRTAPGGEPLQSGVGAGGGRRGGGSLLLRLAAGRPAV